MTTPDANPYASPTSDDGLRSGDAVGVHQQGPLTVIPIGSTLPEVCLFTGKRGTGSFEDKTLVWCPPWVLIFILLNVIILLIVYFFAKKQGRLNYYVDESVRRRRVGLLRWWLGSLAGGIGMITVGLVGSVVWLSIIGAVIAVLWSLATAIMWPRLKIAKIDQRFIYLKELPPEVVEILCAARGVV